MHVTLYSYRNQHKPWLRGRAAQVPLGGMSEATTTHGGYDTVGRPQIISSIRRHLDGCGPSQHLLGYHVASLDGDRGSCETQARVLHLPADPTSELRPYEAVGNYRDELTRTDDGWRIRHRTFEVRIEIGDRQVLLPVR